METRILNIIFKSNLLNQYSSKGKPSAMRKFDRIMLLLCLLFIIGGSANLYSQDKSIKSYEPTQRDIEEGWNMTHEQSGVQLKYKVFEIEVENEVVDKITVKDKVSYLVYKIVNTTNEELKVDWDFELWFNGNCRNCGLKDNINKNDAYHRSFIVPAGKTIYLDPRKEGQDGNNYNAILFKSNNVHLSKFDIVNLSVKRINNYYNN